MDYVVAPGRGASGSIRAFQVQRPVQLLRGGPAREECYVRFELWRAASCSGLICSCLMLAVSVSAAVSTTAARAASLRFAPPVYVDTTLAGGEPSVAYAAEVRAARLHLARGHDPPLHQRRPGRARRVGGLRRRTTATRSTSGPRRTTAQLAARPTSARATNPLGHRASATPT